MNEFARITKIIGEEGQKKLENSNVIVFGIGGVGGSLVESLVRSGIGNITIVDNDIVEATNINRQIIALQSTIGRSKVTVMEERIKDINPKAKVKALNTFLSEENIDTFCIKEYDYIADAIDTVSSKLALINLAKDLKIPIISSLGTGNKLEPTLLREGDIYETRICPLAKKMRKELREIGVEDLKVIYSIEEPVKTGERTPSSMMMVPAAAGLLMSKRIILDLINI